MAKEYKTTKRLLEMLLNINKSPKTVETLSKHHDVTEKIIYEYIEWIKERFSTLKSEGNRYSVELTEEEAKAYKRIVTIKTGRNPLTYYYKNVSLSNQTYSYKGYSSIFEEFLSE